MIVTDVIFFHSSISISTITSVKGWKVVGLVHFLQHYGPSGNFSPCDVNSKFQNPSQESVSFVRATMTISLFFAAQQHQNRQ